MSETSIFPYTEEIVRLLTSGGDERIALDPLTGVNKYGYPAVPEPDVPAYGSSTASAISPAAFQAVCALGAKLQARSAGENPEDFYAREISRMRDTLRRFIGRENIDIIFSDSGTTAHLLGAQAFARADTRPLTIIMLSPEETGRGVPSALGGRFFSQRTPLGDDVSAGAALGPDCVHEIIAVRLRDGNGNPRDLSAIESEVMECAARVVSVGGRVLINPVDCSKTGMVAPGPACLLEIRKQLSPHVDIMVDACQYRLTTATLRAYLDQGFAVVITGSKFMAGPPFSGALMVPDTVAARLRHCSLPPAAGLFSARAEWPESWAARKTMPQAANFGLLLRWEATLTEMRAFHELPEAAVCAFFRLFADTVQARLASDPAFVPLDTPKIDRAPFANTGWDSVQTIFPFLLRRKDGTFLSRDEMRRLYSLAGQGAETLPCRPRFRLGQPVECGERQGVPLSALRLCLSAPLAVDALSESGRGEKGIIAEALAVLDGTAALAETF